MCCKKLLFGLSSAHYLVIEHHQLDRDHGGFIWTGVPNIMFIFMFLSRGGVLRCLKSDPLFAMSNPQKPGVRNPHARGGVHCRVPEVRIGIYKKHGQEVLKFSSASSLASSSDPSFLPSKTLYLSQHEVLRRPCGSHHRYQRQCIELCRR